MRGNSRGAARTFFLIAAGVSVLAGCAGKFTLVDRSDGQIYSGATDGATISGGGNAVLHIEGESYSGPWIYQASGGSFGFGSTTGTTTMSGTATRLGPGMPSTTAMSGFGSTSMTSSAVGVSAVGNGMINARAASGKFVRCIFTFNTMSNTGLGECLRSDGRTYDLNVRR